MILKWNACFLSGFLCSFEKQTLDSTDSRASVFPCSRGTQYIYTRFALILALNDEDNCVTMRNGPRNLICGSK
ncbi:unnamed protein product [Albugo candida]|uniref:Secreted protein n=1 Tax=Albugo candida TaxID=65357 RepID=A0A024G1D2_9STRA|nr:unnamed protein product [Albugo candida]|eukprot:CCI40574.1 unnamed protein product [Albugo candida]